MRRLLLGVAVGVVAMCLEQGAWAQSAPSMTAPSSPADQR
jgi:hypothetical protein